MCRLPLNNKNTKPTQVVQQFPDDQLADKVNKEAQGIIVQYNQQNSVPKSPWQYYKLINVQWSPQPVNLKTPVPGSCRCRKDSRAPTR